MLPPRRAASMHVCVVASPMHRFCERELSGVCLRVSSPAVSCVIHNPDSLCSAEAEKADGRIEWLAGLPPCAACEVAAKRLRTGSALSVRRKKSPHIENLSVIPSNRGETGENTVRVCVCVHSQCSFCSSCVLIMNVPPLYRALRFQGVAVSSNYLHHIDPMF